VCCMCRIATCEAARHAHDLQCWPVPPPLKRVETSLPCRALSSDSKGIKHRSTATAVQLWHDLFILMTVKQCTTPTTRAPPSYACSESGVRGGRRQLAVLTHKP
jgi:hypothetical protein